MILSLSTNPEPWQSVNDGVMGGMSSGRMIACNEGLRFDGEISLQNNGGFASLRRRLNDSLAQATSVRLRVRGDSRRYQFRLFQGNRFDSVAWRVEFTSFGDWQEFEFLFADFQPVFRGRSIPEAGPLVPSQIHQAGFMLADKIAGPFWLEISAIEFFTQ